jgi:hypothetical protein
MLQAVGLHRRTMRHVRRFAQNGLNQALAGDRVALAAQLRY